MSEEKIPEIPTITKLSDLTSYLSALRQRIVELETENQELQKKVNELSAKNNDIIEVIRRRLPNTLLLSDNFFLRALTVWGHFTVIQAIISIGLTLVFILLFFLGIFSNMPPLQ